MGASDWKWLPSQHIWGPRRPGKDMRTYIMHYELWFPCPLDVRLTNT